FVWGPGWGLPRVEFACRAPILRIVHVMLTCSVSSWYASFMQTAGRPTRSREGGPPIHKEDRDDDSRHSTHQGPRSTPRRQQDVGGPGSRQALPVSLRRRSPQRSRLPSQQPLRTSQRTQDLLMGYFSSLGINALDRDLHPINPPAGYYDDPRE